MLRSMGMTPYEQFKVGHMQSKKASGTAIGGLVTAVGAGVAAIAVGFYACAKANEAKRTAAAENAGTAALLKQATDFALTQIRDERQERRQDQITLNQTITDTVSGSQQGTLTATQQAQLDAYQQFMIGLGTGEYSKNPQRVALYQDAQPCPCPCGCNG